MRNPLKRYGLFGWNYWYLITHPWVMVDESYYHVKWFVQRGWRGYADCDSWGLDAYLARWIPDALDRLIKAKHGHPIGMTRKGWETRLRRMKDGFIAVQQMDEAPSAKEHRLLERRMRRGLRVFTEHYLNLWD